MTSYYQCLSLYVGCDTNKGKFIGIINNNLLINTKATQFEEFDVQLLGHTLFLYLRYLADLTEEQSKELIKKGFSIGRPNGYAFSNYGFLYLINLSVDLFGLINSGIAKDIKMLTKEDFID
jgi:hypothetical protein